MKIREIMIHPAITCSETAQLSDVARIMWEHDIGFLPVLNDAGKLTGVITDRDALMAAYFRGKALWEIHVNEAMTPEAKLVTCGPDDEVGNAESLMSDRQIHRVPVVEDGKLVGVLSINDIARSAAMLRDVDVEAQVALALGAITRPRHLH